MKATVLSSKKKQVFAQVFSIEGNTCIFNQILDEEKNQDAQKLKNNSLQMPWFKSRCCNFML